MLVSSKNVLGPGAEFGAYSASKAGAHQLCKVAALELAPYGVRVNLVAPDAVFAPGALAYDVVYGHGPSPFLAQARRAGAGRLADGLGMLIEQAAESYLWWRGTRPGTAPLFTLLRPAT